MPQSRVQIYDNFESAFLCYNGYGNYVTLQVTYAPNPELWANTCLETKLSY